MIIKKVWVLLVINVSLVASELPKPAAPLAGTATVTGVTPRRKRTLSLEEQQALAQTLGQATIERFEVYKIASDQDKKKAEEAKASTTVEKKSKWWCCFSAQG